MQDFRPRLPAFSQKGLPVEEAHIYPEGINLDEYTEIGVETTDSIAIRPAVMYIDRTVRRKFVEAVSELSKNLLLIFNNFN